MPDRATKHGDRKAVKHIEPGYEWNRDKFGPPRGRYDGIPRDEKNALDKMPDKKYQDTVDELMNSNPDKIKCLMVSERERLRSFRHRTIDFSLATLANNGFYFARDEFHCAFCYQSQKFGRTINLKEMHHSRCELCLGTAKDNIPIKERSKATLNMRPKYIRATNIDVVHYKYQRRQVPNGPRLEEIVNEKAKYKQYAEREARKLSYDESKWDSDYPFKNIDLLCDSGFFFGPQIGGKGDKVICFFCDGSLEGWETRDDPWKEHMQTYPRCAYLFLTQGEDMVWTAWNELSMTERDYREGLLYNDEWFKEFKRMPDEQPQLDGYGGEGESPTLASEDQVTHPRITMTETVGYQFAHQEGVPSDRMSALWPYHREEFETAAQLMRLLHTFYDDGLYNETVDRSNEVQIDAMQVDYVQSEPPKQQPQYEQSIACLSPECVNMKAAVVIPCGCMSVCEACQPDVGSKIQQCPKCHQPANRALVARL